MPIHDSSNCTIDSNIPCHVFFLIQSASSVQLKGEPASLYIAYYPESDDVLRSERYECGHTPYNNGHAPYDNDHAEMNGAMWSLCELYAGGLATI